MEKLPVLSTETRCEVSKSAFVNVQTSQQCRSTSRIDGPVHLPSHQPPLLEAAWHRSGRAVTSLPPICEWAANEETWSAEGSRRHWGVGAFLTLRRPGPPCGRMTFDLQPTAERHSTCQECVHTLWPSTSRRVGEVTEGEGWGATTSSFLQTQTERVCSRTLARVFWK